MRGIATERSREIQRQRDVETGRQKAPIHQFTPPDTCSGWDWAEAADKDQEHNPGLPCVWQETNYLIHHWCLPGPALLAGSWNRESNPDTPTWNTDILTAWLNATPAFLS